MSEPYPDNTLPGDLLTEPLDGGPSPEFPDLSDAPIIPLEQILSIAATPGPQPLCYRRHPTTGRPCDLTLYHPGDHHVTTLDTSRDGYDYVDTYWSSETAPGPIPDPDPPWPLPDPVPSPDPGPS